MRLRNDTFATDKALTDLLHLFIAHVLTKCDQTARNFLLTA